MYLYRQGDRGWGRYIARNDDTWGIGYFSRIEESLGAGVYRVLIKGYSRWTEGPFALDATCDGAGCPGAEVPDPPVNGWRDCASADDCAEGERCEGFVREVGLGQCVSLEPIPGDGDECGEGRAACGEGLVCAGVALDPSWGLCNPAWMRGTFEDGETTAIPDESTVERTLYAYGLATVSTDVVIAGTITHTYPGDLLITLTNPSGTEATVFDGETDDFDSESLVLDGALVGFPGTRT